MASRRRTIGAGALKVGVAALSLLPAEVRAEPVDRWAFEIGRASARFGIPEAWIRRVMRVESGGRLLFDGRPIVSRAGAMGLMQLMPGTWRDMRFALGLGADPNDPGDNIAAGTFYLRLMYNRFGYPGLFAAYNAGPARYAASLTGAHPLPAETRAYVAAIIPASVERPLKQGQSAGLFALEGSASDDRPGHPAKLPKGGLFVALGDAPPR